VFLSGELLGPNDDLRSRAAAFGISPFDVRESALRRSGSIGARRRDLA